MKNYRKLLVFDFESNGLDTTKCDPVQIAGIMLNARSLEPENNGEFYLKIKPAGIENREKFLEDDDTRRCVAWHVKTRGISQKELLDEWSESIEQKLGWLQFVEWIYGFNPQKKMSGAPIPCGANISNFDLIIAKRLNEKYGIKNLFWERDSIDIHSLCFSWFENLSNGPKNFKMDTLREFFGMSADNAHDALQDVKDEALIITKFIKLNRRYSDKVKFRNALKLVEA